MQRIDVNDDQEVFIWARTFGITGDELKRLVKEVGAAPEAIRSALKRDELAKSGGRNRVP